MRFLIDTNILLHAVNSASPAHKQARGFLDEHLRRGTSWCTSWPIWYEFLRVSTHRRVFPDPLTGSEALKFVTSILARDQITILSPTARHLEVLRNVLNDLHQPAGNLFHDIHTATLLREHGVPEIVTADTDFLQFPFLQVINPLL